jgi:hypothetical protein
MASGTLALQSVAFFGNVSEFKMAGKHIGIIEM